MSKNRVIVLSVEHQHLTIKEVAHKYGVSERWVYTLLKRYRANGLNALEPESKRPKTHPQQTNKQTIDLIKDLRVSLTSQGLDAGATTIAWHLNQKGIKAPAISTI